MRGTHLNSLEALRRNRHKGQFNSVTAVINGEKGRRTEHELKSIGEELKRMLDGTDEHGQTQRHLLAEIVLERAADSPKWYELMLKLAGELPPGTANININAPDCADTQFMLAELHAHCKTL